MNAVVEEMDEVVVVGASLGSCSGWCWSCDFFHPRI